MSQAEMARLVGFSPSHFGRYLKKAVDAVDYVIEDCLNRSKHSYDDIREALYENAETR